MQINEVIMVTVKAIFETVGTDFYVSNTEFGMLYTGNKAVDKNREGNRRFLYLYVDEHADGSLEMSAYLDSPAGTEQTKVGHLRVCEDTTVKQLSEFISNCTRYKCLKS